MFVAYKKNKPDAEEKKGAPMQKRRRQLGQFNEAEERVSKMEDDKVKAMLARALAALATDKNTTLESVIREIDERFRGPC
jgi:hypothetical protein